MSPLASECIRSAIMDGEGFAAPDIEYARLSMKLRCAWQAFQFAAFPQPLGAAVRMVWDWCALTDREQEILSEFIAEVYL